MDNRNLDQLTPREREVLALVDRGLTNDEIAERLSISLSGVKHHVSQIISKAGVNRRYEAGPSLGRNWLGLGWRFALGAVATAVVAAVVALGVAVLVDSSDEEEPSAQVPPSISPTGTEAPTDTPEPTPVVLTPTGVQTPRYSNQQVADVLSEPGFQDFAQQLAVAAEANDTQFFIDRALFQVNYCPAPSGAVTPVPVWCGMYLPPPEPVIPVGLWNSEGDVFLPEAYAELITSRLRGDTAPDAYLYAIGRAKRGSTEPDIVASIVVANVGNAFPTGSAHPLIALVFSVAPIDGQWSITDVSRGSVPLVPDFFEWWAPWPAAFPDQP